MELCLEDIKNIEDSLYLKHKFLEFNENNLRNMLFHQKEKSITNC